MSDALYEIMAAAIEGAVEPMAVRKWVCPKCLRKYTLTPAQSKNHVRSCRVKTDG